MSEDCLHCQVAALLRSRPPGEKRMNVIGLVVQVVAELIADAPKKLRATYEDLAVEHLKSCVEAAVASLDEKPETAVEGIEPTHPGSGAKH